MSVLARLDGFRGASRFTTWVYTFALLEAAVKLRKRAWQGREVPLDEETWNLFSSVGLGPADAAEQSELLAAISHRPSRSRRINEGDTQLRADARTATRSPTP